MKRFKQLPSPPMVISLIALVVAMAGTGYAAVALAPNSVGTKQLKRGAVKNSDIGSSAVTSAKVRDGSLLARDFGTGQLPAGPKGDKGDTGATGATGATGPPGTNGTNGTNGADGAAGATNVTTRSVTQSLAVGEQSLTAPCNGGEKAVGGGGAVPSADPEVTLEGTFPSPSGDGTTPTGWTARFEVTGIPHNVTTWVVCAAP